MRRQSVLPQPRPAIQLYVTSVTWRSVLKCASAAESRLARLPVSRYSHIYRRPGSWINFTFIGVMRLSPKCHMSRPATPRKQLPRRNHGLGLARKGFYSTSLLRYPALVLVLGFWQRCACQQTNFCVFYMFSSNQLTAAL